MRDMKQSIYSKTTKIKLVYNNFGIKKRNLIDI